MALYVEIHCDVMKEGRDPRDILKALCWSHSNNNPQGHSAASTRKQAKREGWKVGPGNYAVCPGCQDRPAPSPDKGE